MPKSHHAVQMRALRKKKAALGLKEFRADLLPDEYVLFTQMYEAAKLQRKLRGIDLGLIGATPKR
jgi:hypothetical protein